MRPAKRTLISFTCLLLAACSSGPPLAGMSDQLPTHHRAAVAAPETPAALLVTSAKRMAAHQALRAERRRERRHERLVRARRRARREAAARAAAVAAGTQPVMPVAAADPLPSSGVLSPVQVETLWVQAGGPSWAASAAASIAFCESGDNPNAYNPSGASGLWQILGQVVGGDIFDPLVNALNAVAKFKASGNTFAQWVCRA